MQAQSTAVLGVMLSPDKHIMPPGMPPNGSRDWAAATTSALHAMYVATPLDASLQARRLPFSPQQNSIWPCSLLPAPRPVMSALKEMLFQCRDVVWRSVDGPSTAVTVCFE
jgi:hypothetical protein